MDGAEVEPRVGLVPVLRAGLGMVDAMLELIPTAQVWHIGLYRDERTLKPVEYYNKLPDAATVQVCLILDPMLATGGSAAATVDILKAWGAARIKQVSLIAAPEGVATLSACASGRRHPRGGRRSRAERARLHRARPGRRRRPPVRHLRRPRVRARACGQATRRPRWCAACSGTSPAAPDEGAAPACTASRGFSGNEMSRKNCPRT